MTSLWLVLPGLIIWSSILVLPWRPWSTRESLNANTSLSSDLSRITVLIPARNEQEVIGRTLLSLERQGELGEIILIDDQSTDTTVACARQTGLKRLRIISGRPLAEGWSGKLWALEQGRERVRTDFTLLLDADIELAPGTITTLLDKLDDDKLDMVSLMAFLRMQSFWEVLLMPAFIYFFKLLYPFALSNSNSKLVAAAAGGCILIKTNKLTEIGGFCALKDELIDDCSLARHIKRSGGRTWIGLSRSAVSHRCYDTLQTVWGMVVRTAYTQLHYSVSLLFLCTVLMLSAFVLPVISVFVTDLPILLFPVVTILMMIATYVPVLRYYELNPLWACTLPVAGVLYLCMTWNSAFRHWRGDGTIWKNRAYARRMN